MFSINSRRLPGDQNCSSPSVAKLLSQDDSFFDITKASYHLSAIRQWFEKIILRDNDNNFDQLFQNINQKILKN